MSATIKAAPPADAVWVSVVSARVEMLCGKCGEREYIASGSARDVMRRMRRFRDRHRARVGTAHG